MIEIKMRILSFQIPLSNLKIIISNDTINVHKMDGNVLSLVNLKRMNVNK